MIFTQPFVFGYVAKKNKYRRAGAPVAVMRSPTQRIGDAPTALRIGKFPCAFWRLSSPPVLTGEVIG
ncbi:hypothetical protein [Bathymodiolus platifrons methanotrophic gill symbiont]|uniref:hypothetical protein n=1 Tax=Bathymodiolus platifrons methanotrophic gill symbiont TaxID=113268 RepID=UPI001C8E686C|nr:hypothetical protein [Bathymodiolus platifrons methanotrophic gill symbiont]